MDASNGEKLRTIGMDLALKAGARVLPGAILYGIYLILMFSLLRILYRRRNQLNGSLFLVITTIIMFLGSTLFLCLDVADLIARIQIIMVDNPEFSLEEKLAMATHKLKKLTWTGYMLFIFMMIPGDAIVLWRAWSLYEGARLWLALPVATLLGSTVSALFELGCHLKTDWAITSYDPKAEPVGAKACRQADMASFALSYVTNIICTMLIARRAWQHRKAMTMYLGKARPNTQVEKVLTLLIESGSIYVIIYTLQAIPIFNATSFEGSANVAFNVVNVIYQQALGMYPTIIIILVQKQKSLWDVPEVWGSQSQTFDKTVQSPTRMQFARPAVGSSDAGTSTLGSTTRQSHSVIPMTTFNLRRLSEDDMDKDDKDKLKQKVDPSEC